MISTHILDTSEGRPATGVPVELSRREADGTWTVLGSAETDADGRCPDLPALGRSGPGTVDVRLVFDVAAYRRARGETPFFPEVRVIFTVDLETRYHVPLLLNPYGYSVYRGS
ncbi:hydroxyisourate hydrolase [Streptomyces sp. SID3343]|uniref:hydroxyisourate hydrolase n=1 Tax=Streptomyces sp. SID3343 TaxID=2690260 RepID=UPI00136B7F9B|nr:hydroxyisourate hydrolase [Streptomyces sp. SID3343]